MWHWDKIQVEWGTKRIIKQQCRPIPKRRQERKGRSSGSCLDTRQLSGKFDKSGNLKSITSQSCPISPRHESALVSLLCWMVNREQPAHWKYDLSANVMVIHHSYWTRLNYCAVGSELCIVKASRMTSYPFNFPCWEERGLWVKTPELFLFFHSFNSV